MTDTDLVIATQTEFEGFLRYTLDANGEKFHDLITSIKERVPRSLVDDLHYIRKERNSLAHGRKRQLDSRREFGLTATRIRESLLRAAAAPGSDVGYLIVNKNSGKCLDVPWEMESHLVHQWECHKNINQQWVLRKVEESVAIISRYTGRCLDVDHGSDEDNAGVSQWKYEGTWNQQWILRQLEDHSYQICARHSEKVLDLVWGSADDGATTTQYHWHGGDNQRWWIGPAL